MRDSVPKMQVARNASKPSGLRFAAHALARFPSENGAPGLMGEAAVRCVVDSWLWKHEQAMSALCCSSTRAARAETLDLIVFSSAGRRVGRIDEAILVMRVLTWPSRPRTVVAVLGALERIATDSEI